MSAELRLYPDRLGKVPPTGAVESVQEAELRLSEPGDEVINRNFLEHAAAAYWRLIRRFTLGLIRVPSRAGDQCVVLIAAPLVLLRFHPPDYEISDREGSVTWRIKRGILVSKRGRDRGLLRFSVRSIEDPGRVSRFQLRMEVQNFYPWLRGTGPFASVGVWIYAQTQQRIHRRVTRAFLCRLERLGAAGPRS
jgi:hypothetical protein